MSFLRIFSRSVVLFFFFSAVAAFCATLYSEYVFGKIYFAQILQNFQGLSGVGRPIIRAYVLWTLLPSLTLLFLTCFFDVRLRYLLAVGTALVIFCLIRLEVPAFLTHRFVYTDLYEKVYVDPQKQDYIFPQKKRNLIMLYLESFEDDTSAEPLELTRLKSLKDSVSFEGFHQIDWQNYTIAAMVGSLCGIPFQTVKTDLYGLSNFLPLAVCYSNILHNNGYRSYFLKGSDVTFARTNLFFETHGFDRIIGPNQIENDEHIDPKTHQGTSWGYRDRTLYEVAKKEISTLAAKEQPFMLTMITLDTHEPDIYLDPACPQTGNQRYDVRHCADQMAADFIAWVQKQKFYPDTTIIVLGDHPSRFISSKRSDSSIFNAFINAKAQAPKTNRIWTVYDIAPSILDALGIRFESESFGLGRSLFSSAPTLLESLGRSFETELSKNSHYYEKFDFYNRAAEYEYPPVSAFGRFLSAQEIKPFAPYAQEVQNLIWADKLAFTLPEKADKSVKVNLRFQLVFDHLTESRTIYVNSQKVAELSFSVTEKQPFETTIDIPEAFLDTSRHVLIEFRGKEERSAVKIGLGLQNLKLDK